MPTIKLVIKRKAGSEFEHGSDTKKPCLLPQMSNMPTRTKPSKEPIPISPNHNMVTRGMTTRYSTAAVLNTYELLEAILCELPMVQILEVRHVCKTWNKVIKQSKPLRTKLFLYPQPRNSLWIMDRKSLVLKPYEFGSRERLGDHWMHGQAVSRPSIVNPLLFKHDPTLRSPLGVRAMVCEAMYLTASPNMSKRSSIVHQMYVTQPPVSVVQFTFYFTATKQPGKAYRRADDYRTVRIVKPAGVKFGDMLAAFREEVEYPPGRYSSYMVSIKAQSSSPARKSVIYMMGSVFVNEEERAYVETFREKPADGELSKEPGWVSNVLCMNG